MIYRYGTFVDETVAAKYVQDSILKLSHAWQSLLGCGPGELYLVYER